MKTLFWGEINRGGQEYNIKKISELFSHIFQASLFDCESLFLEKRVKKFSRLTNYSSLIKDVKLCFFGFFEFGGSNSFDLYMFDSIDDNYLRNIFSNWDYYPLGVDGLFLNHKVYLNEQQILKHENDIQRLELEVSRKRSLIKKLKSFFQ